MFSNHQLVFICGLHRSGTSIFFKSLKQHPDISGFENTNVDEDEGQFLQSVYPIAKKFGGPGRFGFAPEMHLTESSKLITPQNRDTLFREWSKYWNLDRPILVEKSPPNLIKTRFLQALFPQATFIVITRHPIAVALATKKWSYTSLQSLIHHWVHCHQLFEEDRPFLKRVYSFRYEDFIQDPNNILRQVYDLLNIQFLPTNLTIRSGINDAYIQKWEDLKSKWINRLYFKRIETRFETAVNAFGYSLRPPYTYQSSSE